MVRRSPKRKVRINIRQMEIDDISAVYRLGESLFTSEEFPILYRTWDPWEVTDFFTSDPEYCLVAETEPSGKIVGFALATILEKKGTAWRRYGYLTWIGIDDKFQRSRLGYRLYRRMEQKFKKDGVRMMMVDTEEDNEDAISFFTSLGFSPGGGHIWLTKILPGRAKKATASAVATARRDEGGGSSR
ncbi:MAG: GNAT family N-acetyltransferase [Chloroflexota bacterium]